MPAKTHSVIIVGAGKIGAFFDTPGSNSFLTHGHAFSAHPGFSIRGFVDTDQERAQAAAKLWGGQSFYSLAEAFSRERADIIVVASPDDTHADFLREAADYSPRLVFAEKPLATSAEEAESIVDLYRNKHIPLAVNYSRRYVAAFSGLSARIREGEFGRFLTGVGHYGKGIVHNGSHMVDLLRLLFGPVRKIQALESIVDWKMTDPTISARLLFEEGASFLMLGVDCRTYSVFEIDLFFEKARLRIIDSEFGYQLQKVIDSPVFHGYRVLSDAVTQPIKLNRALYEAAENIHRHLSCDSPLACTGEDALDTLRLSLEIGKAQA